MIESEKQELLVPPVAPEVVGWTQGWLLAFGQRSGVNSCMHLCLFVCEAINFSAPHTELKIPLSKHSSLCYRTSRCTRVTQSNAF